MKNLIIIISIIFSINQQSIGQSELQLTIEKEFMEDYCNCLQAHAKLDTETLLLDQTEVCIRQFFADNAESVNQLVLESDVVAASDYEKGKEVGRQLIFNIIDDLVIECKVYRQTLDEYKQLLIGQTRATKESSGEIIALFQNALTQAASKSDQSTIYTVLGILHEFIGDEKEALINYDKALELHPSTQAKGLKQLLIMASE